MHLLAGFAYLSDGPTVCLSSYLSLSHCHSCSSACLSSNPVILSASPYVYLSVLLVEVR